MRDANYQIFLRFSRGGIGIPYELAKAELLAVFSHFGVEIKKELPARHRIWIALPLLPDEVSTIASDLGYTAAVLHLRREPYRGEPLRPVRRDRWHVGWVREGQWKVYQTEVYIQDAESLLAAGPNRQTFEIQQDGERRSVYGHKAHRALSTLDARFLLNIANPSSTDTLLDPFAGFGGIVSEAKRRGLRIVASDIDESLLPGLTALNPESYFVADARHLPLAADLFNLIVTEPPFHTSCHQAVVESLSELHRVLKPRARMILLIHRDMYQGIRSSIKRMGLDIDLIGIIPRGGGLKCPVLEIRLPL